MNAGQKNVVKGLVRCVDLALERKRQKIFLGVSLIKIDAHNGKDKPIVQRDDAGDSCGTDGPRTADKPRLLFQKSGQTGLEESDSRVIKEFRPDLIYSQCR